jgi:ribosomal protein S18 acetylase RimI-like enzyme
VDAGRLTRVERVTRATPEHVAAFARLLPQLSPGARRPTLADLEEVVAAPGTSLLVARDGQGAIVGTLTLVVYPTPNKRLALIEDVVVAREARRRGIDTALVTEALRLAQEARAAQTDLLSHDRREAAIRLYRRLGFERFETNVFRYLHRSREG